MSAEQVEVTRKAILDAAERLFAEFGVHTVSNRQIAVAAGQGNTNAVGYHFGTKVDLVRAILRRHLDAIGETRGRMMAEIGDVNCIRDWAACTVRPITEHLAALATPSWFARFSAQVAADPGLFEFLSQDSVLLSARQEAGSVLDRLLPHLPSEIIAVRVLMARHLIVQMCVETERALAEGSAIGRLNWNDTADDLVDAVVALWEASVRG